METLSDTQRGHVTTWNEQHDGFAKVLNNKNVSLDDLRAIAPFLDLKQGYTWFNQEVCIYSDVANQASHDQFKILLAVDTKGVFNVSTDYNNMLETAMRLDDSEMISMIICHSTFVYPGSGSHNRYTQWYELMPAHKYLDRTEKSLTINDQFQMLLSVFSQLKIEHKAIMFAEIINYYFINKKFDPAITQRVINTFQLL